jgi:hypothetical protein
MKNKKKKIILSLSIFLAAFLAVFSFFVWLNSGNKSFSSVEANLFSLADIASGNGAALSASCDAGLPTCGSVYYSDVAPTDYCTISSQTSCSTGCGWGNYQDSCGIYYCGVLYNQCNYNPYLTCYVSDCSSRSSSNLAHTHDSWPSCFVACCGDGICNNGETCNTCPGDCGTCCTPLDCSDNGNYCVGVPYYPNSCTTCIGTKPVDCSCAANICTGQTCSDGCGGTCNGTKSSSNGVCGTASTSNQVWSSAPSGSILCADGSTPTVSLSGTSWTWSCLGTCNGSSASCSAQRDMNWRETAP